MSADTALQIRYLGGDFIEVKSRSEEILAILAQDKSFAGFLSELDEAFTNGEYVFNCSPDYLQSLVIRVQQLFPEAHFEARILGEFFRQTWVAEFKNGECIFSQGPWA